MTIQEILQSNDIDKKLGLFYFGSATNADQMVTKFNIWGRYFFPKYFKSSEAPFHRQMDLHNIACYRGEISSYTNIGFRGCAKTTRTKLFFAYVIANDQYHSQKYLKVLSEDGDNSKQAVTDIYNTFMDAKTMIYYPEIFAKTDFKREETMSSFTTATGVKLTAGTVGTDQRGDIAEDVRPGLIWFDDFETKKTLRSPVETKAIWDNMEEAKNGLSKGGGSIYTCNYISERGNVHKLVQNKSLRNIVMITPIEDENGNPTWSIYTKSDIEHLRTSVDDFQGEYQCKPSASSDVLFDRFILEGLVSKPPIREIAGFKVFYPYDQSHRIAGGADVAGGVGLDSSTSVFIDFDTVPCRVVATYKSNTIKPDTFGYELQRHGDFFGQCLLAPERNNHGAATIAILKQLYDLSKIFYQHNKQDTAIDEKKPAIDYGWHTNGASKPKMLFGLKKAVEDGLLELVDEDLIAEAKSYSRDDLLDREIDPRLTTRHFDLLIAAAIAWQMKDYAEAKTSAKYIPLEEDDVNDLMFQDIGI